MSGLPECLCRSATAFRFVLCDLTRLELHLHGPGGRGGPGENCPSPLRDGVQNKEPERSQRSEIQAVLSSSSCEELHQTGVPEAQLWMETIKQPTISISTTQTNQNLNAELPASNSNLHFHSVKNLLEDIQNVHSVFH